ncbi:MAG: glycosyltransferase [bacterium]|nr:glycosyltransferase [bacterium]
MEKEKQLSFIILNFKSRDLLRDCLDSIYSNANGIDFEIIIINNDTPALNLEGGVKIINSENNSGFGKSCNIGAKASKGKLLCFLNSDARFLTAITKTTDYLNNNYIVGIVGPRLMTQDDKIQEWSAGAEVNLWDLVKYHLRIKASK